MATIITAAVNFVAVNEAASNVTIGSFLICVYTMYRPCKDSTCTDRCTVRRTDNHNLYLDNL